jgi:hypothetical protein
MILDEARHELDQVLRGQHEELSVRVKNLESGPFFSSMASFE